MKDRRTPTWKAFHSSAHARAMILMMPHLLFVLLLLSVLHLPLRLIHDMFRCPHGHAPRQWRRVVHEDVIPWLVPFYSRLDKQATKN
jgi:hypothetical protein